VDHVVRRGSSGVVLVVSELLDTDRLALETSRIPVVLVDPVGNARRYRINATCIDCFPSAADVVMGRPAPIPVEVSS
jgi:hypothetical protein